MVVLCLKLHNCYHIAITMLFACSFVFHFRALLTSKAISDKICVFACLLYCITLHIYVQKVILHTTNKEAEHFMFIFRLKKAFPNKKTLLFCKRTPISNRLQVCLVCICMYINVISSWFRVMHIAHLMTILEVHSSCKSRNNIR